MAKKTASKISYFFKALLDDYAHAVALWVFIVGCLVSAVILIKFTAAPFLLYMTAFLTSGILATLCFIGLVGWYRKRKYQKDTRQTEEFRSSMNFVQGHSADDLTDEQISVLVNRIMHK